MKNFLIARRLYAKERRTSPAHVLLALSLALGIAALVTINTLSRRIDNTVRRDSKNLLAADYQIQARRPFDEKIWETFAPERARGDLVLLNDYVATMFYADTNAVVSVRAIEGHGYPFYGTLLTNPPVAMSDLEATPEIILDKSFAAKGVHLGDAVKLGRLTLKVRAFLIDEPQSIGSVFALGARVMLPRKWSELTGLTGTGARVFHQLLIKSPLSTEAFTKRFRSRVPDPHWRLMTPEKSNRQAERLLERMRGFLSFVGIAGLFLGMIGLFTVFRAQFFSRLPSYLTLRCLGAQKGALVFLAVLNSLTVALYGWIAGTAMGLGLEAWLTALARRNLGVELADVTWLPAFAWGFGLAAVCVGISVWVPMRQVLRIPVANAIRTDELGAGTFSWRDAMIFVFAALAIIFLLGPQLRMSAIFLLGMVSTLALLLSLSFALSRWLRSERGSFAFRHAKLLFVRKPARSQLLVLSIGMALFFLLAVLSIGNSLRRHLSLVDRTDVPNVFAIGVAPESLAGLAKEIPALHSMPIMQARIVEIKGKPIPPAKVSADSSADDESDRFFYTREYTVTRESKLGLGETLVAGTTEFGPPQAGVVRLSVEQEFAKKLELRIDDTLKVELAGVSLVAELRSIRKVDWSNFQPNFFLVFNADDLAAAPMDYVAYARVPKNEIAGLQTRVAQKFPQITLLDGEVLAARILHIIEQLSFAVLAVSLFSLLSCVFVFAGIFLARRPELLREIGLWRCLGMRSSVIFRIYVFEALTTGTVGALSSLMASTMVVWALSYWVFDLPLHLPTLPLVLGTLVATPGLAAGAAYLILRSTMRTTSQSLLRLAEEAI